MFGVYVMLDDKNVLDAQKVFVSMALINILKTPLSQLPFAISTTLQVGCISSPSPIEEIIFHSPQFNSTYRPFHFWLFQAVVSLKRLGKYLCSEELKMENVSKAPLSSGKNPTHIYTITLNEYTSILFSFTNIQFGSPYCLKSQAVIINISIPQDVVVYNCGLPQPCMDHVHCHFLGPQADW